MKAEVDGSKILAGIAFLLITTLSFGQVIRSGEIVFEKRTNLEKRYEGSQTMGNSKEWMKEPKKDEYVLYFTDSTSLFKPILPEVGDEDREWSTMKNTTYQNLNSGKLERQFLYYGAEIYLLDTVKKREWIITENRRTIAGFETKQALWVANDSTNIYAWYAEKIIPSVGPESFNGLPGAILGLALEDGGVVYFAKEVKPLSKKNIEKEMPKGKAKDYYTSIDIRKLVKELFSGRGSGGRILDDIFVW
ncbi:GLPGLI family protein [Brumimicrobium glaciale]|jgi:GLPGLI family protein|uniref:GLPGLI family protein n=1 Tax=Brumimicrobium glaciale TaxID=200475 RepID=A0A4Q4KM46_9FLAO|nr:GLPGLI family protein [Brumimicrobium glaciale]RYM32949.1 GLPGLI family protein [Brumimicrobium glaciale]